MDLNVTTEDLLSSVLVELADERQLIRLDESSNLGLGDGSALSQVVSALVELLEEHNSVWLGLQLIEDGLLSGDAESDGINGLGDVLEGLSLGRVERLEETDDGDLVVTLQLVQLIDSSQGDSSWSGLLFQPEDDLV